MRRLTTWSLCLALASALPAGGAAAADKDKGKDELPGAARWEWKLYNGKGDEVDAGTFIGTVTGEVKKGKDVIGAWTAPAKDKVNVTFTEGPLKGKAELSQTKADPPTFEGDLEKNGAKHKFVVKLLKD
jgi:hypothetical protein